MITRFKSRTYLLFSLCALTTVLALSTICIVYLLLSVYFPLGQTAEFAKVPVMCSLLSRKTLRECLDDGVSTWSSCRNIGNHSCTQIRVNVRRNGTTVRLEGCGPATFVTKYCYDNNPNQHQFKCINGECSALHGIMNCTAPRYSPTGDVEGSFCRNITTLLDCNITKTDIPILCNSRKACLKLHGLYTCDYGECAKILEPYQCTPQCTGIKTLEKNVIIKQGDVVHTAKCSAAVDVNSGALIWSKNNTNTDKWALVLMMSCTTKSPTLNNVTTYTFSDCVNETLLKAEDLGEATSITSILESYQRSPNWLQAPPMRLIPKEGDLVLYDNAKFLASTEDGYGECGTVIAEIEKGQENIWGSENFPCFYTHDGADYATNRYRVRGDAIVNVLALTVVPLILIVGSGAALLYIGCRLCREAGKDSSFNLRCCFSSEEAGPKVGTLETVDTTAF